MLNLTNSAITLLAESGETTEIPASGYVARVERERRVWLGECDFTLIEETPTEIVVDYIAFGVSESHPLAEEMPTTAGALLLATREVAEAAATLNHPLWRRMAWPSDFANYPIADAPGFGNGWRSLHRVPQGGA